MLLISAGSGLRIGYLLIEGFSFGASAFTFGFSLILGTVIFAIGKYLENDKIFETKKKCEESIN